MPPHGRRARTIRPVDEIRAAPCVWLTGRRGAGKRTVGTLAVETMRSEGRRVALLDAEALTEHLARGPADGGLASLAWLATLLTSNGVPVVITVDTPRRSERDALRHAIDGFVEVLIDAPPEVCIERAGVADPVYEEPIAPDLRIPTADRDARASAAQLVSYLDHLLPGPGN
jgi:adenylylsulfate kinase